MMNSKLGTSQEADLGKKLLELYSQPGISGTCLQLGRKVVRHDLPFSDSRVAEFASRLDHLFASYESVGRHVWQLCTGFKEYWLLVLCRDDLRLTVLANPGADTATIASRTMHVLMQIEPLARQTSPSPAARSPQFNSSSNGTSARPPVERAQLETQLAGLLGRVIGSAQASRLISREFATHAVGERLTLDQAREVGQAVLDYVPNRGKRSSLLSEFNSSL
jgi:hypothetical protein